ncbi:hypothetical protein IJG26_02890 [Candidatus Saccharibacteria bacterium]|nr:hypothetical protein [Candidatus Saccharibacteria bacterium]
MTTATIKLPSKVIDSDWKDDINYETYEHEKTYVSPKNVKKETITKIKNSPIKLTIRNMIDWKKVSGRLAA